MDANAVVVDGHREFLSKVRSFPDEVYRFEPGDYLYRLMWVLLEDPGVGQLKKFQSVARLSETLAGTNFTDLDYFFGEFLRFGRAPTEQYPYDPFNDQLTSAQWDEVHVKDASYRERIGMFMQALLRGGTNEGIQMAAEAASGFPCQVLEVWRYTTSLGIGAVGRLNAAKEFVVVPLEEGITPSEERAIYRTVERLKPANTFCTVDVNGLAVQSIVSVLHAISPSEFFEIRRYVTTSGFPQPADTIRSWVRANEEVEAPLFAHMRTMETGWSLNESVTSVGTFAYVLSDGPSDPPAGSGLPPGFLPQPLNVETQQFGPWRAVDIADSPDNYPGSGTSPAGKYPGDPNKYDDRGNYVFAWTSQAQYLSFLERTTLLLGGQFMGSRYRLPITLEVTPGQQSRPEYALAGPELAVRSTYYGTPSG